MAAPVIGRPAVGVQFDAAHDDVFSGCAAIASRVAAGTSRPAGDFVKTASMRARLAARLTSTNAAPTSPAPPAVTSSILTGVPQEKSKWANAKHPTGPCHWKKTRAARLKCATQRPIDTGASLIGVEAVEVRKVVAVSLLAVALLLVNLLLPLPRGGPHSLTAARCTTITNSGLRATN
jgi:hypothetical protein